MNNEDYVQFKIVIPKSLDMKFRELVSMKHPNYQRGALSYEGEIALRQYLACYSSVDMHAHTHNNELQAEESNPSPKIYALKQSIFKWLIDSQLYLEVPQFIPEVHLANAIGALKGYDQRTLKKYLKLLQDFGCIKKSGIKQYEFV